MQEVVAAFPGWGVTGPGPVFLVRTPGFHLRVTEASLWVVEDVHGDAPSVSSSSLQDARDRFLYNAQERIQEVKKALVVCPDPGLGPRWEKTAVGWARTYTGGRLIVQRENSLWCASWESKDHADSRYGDTAQSALGFLEEQSREHVVILRQELADTEAALEALCSLK